MRINNDVYRDICKVYGAWLLENGKVFSSEKEMNTVVRIFNGRMKLKVHIPSVKDSSEYMAYVATDGDVYCRLCNKSEWWDAGHYGWIDNPTSIQIQNAKFIVMYYANKTIINDHPIKAGLRVQYNQGKEYHVCKALECLLDTAHKSELHTMFGDPKEAKRIGKMAN